MDTRGRFCIAVLAAGVSGICIQATEAQRSPQIQAAGQLDSRDNQVETHGLLDPVCTIEGASNCQPFDDGVAAQLSDLSIGEAGRTTADDFVPHGDTLSTVCVWGVYMDAGPDTAELDCGNVAVDDFHVRVFASDHPSGAPLPGTLVGWSDATAVRQIVPGSQFSAAHGVEMYAFQLTLDQSITGLDDSGSTCYWLEVANNVVLGEDPEDDTCNWYWGQTNAAGNDFAAVGDVYNYGYDVGSERAFDVAYCLGVPAGPLDIEPDGCGELQRACCACDGTCTVETLLSCDQAGNRWDLLEEDCEPTPCVDYSAGGVPGDDCLTNAFGGEDVNPADGIADGIPPGNYMFSNFCTTTDGANPVETELGPRNMENDLWFFFRAESDCDLLVSLCQNGDAFDSIVAIYHDPDNPTVCPCPLAGDIETHERVAYRDDESVYAADENCNGILDGGGGHLWRVSGLVAGICAVQDPTNPGIEAGYCYTIRVGGAAGPDGIGVGGVSFSCPSGTPIGEPLPDPSGIDKNRFISFQGDPYLVFQPYALRARLCSLHHPDPENVPGLPAPDFSELETDVRWVGPPEVVAETPDPETFFTAAPLQCTSHYRDWSPEALLADGFPSGVVHVYGEEIVPSSWYDLQLIPDFWAGAEDYEGNYGWPLRVTTARWGDVVAPFQAPSPAVLSQPDFFDVSAVIDKWQNTDAGAPIIARADLDPQVPNQSMNFFDISAVIDAWSSLAYPYAISTSCP